MASTGSVSTRLDMGRERRKAIIGSTIGTSIEYFDFFLYGTMAAVVFPKVFFPESSAYTGALQSFATFAIGFAARPIGGAIFGHIGDKLGRKYSLMMTLSLMAAGTMLIGVIPSYAQIGPWSGVILVILRLVQGLGVGGEWGGSVLLSMEWAEKGRRGVAASFPQAAVPIGLLLSNGVVALLLSTTSPQAYLTWGWRIAFLASGVLFGVGLFIRKRVTESPAFSNMRDTDGVEKRPLVTAVKGNWRQILLCALVAAPDLAIFYVFSTFIFTFVKDELGRSQTFATTCVVVGAAVSMFAIPAFGLLSDRLGRKRVYMTGLAVIAAWVWVYFGLLNTGDGALISIAIVAGFIPHAMVHGPQAALIAESFGSKVRYSGASLGYQLASVIAGGPAPLIALALYHHVHTGYTIAAYLLGLTVIGMIATAFLRPSVEPDRIAQGARPNPTEDPEPLHMSVPVQVHAAVPTTQDVL